MHDIALVADSSACLPPALAHALGIRVLPITVHLPDADYRDGVDRLARGVYRALERDPRNRYATAHDFAWDLQHQDQVGVSERAELHNWKERRTPWPRRIVFYVALALVPVLIFALLLYVAKHS